MQALPMLASAALLEAAGRCLASLKPAPGASAARIPCSTHQKVLYFSCTLVSGVHVLNLLPEGTACTQHFLLRDWRSMNVGLCRAIGLRA